MNEFKKLDLHINKMRVLIKQFSFPGGEQHVQLVNPPKVDWFDVKIEAMLHNSDDIMRLMLLVNALKRSKEFIKTTILNLHIPYIPYARQDRVANTNESLSIEVMANIINSFEANEVKMNDIHSDVAMALIKNSVNVDQFKTILNVDYDIPDSNAIIVAPDAGAAKKSYSIAKLFGADMIQGFKVRDTSTGEITGTEIIAPDIDMSNRNFVIIDDICDGGRTFIELAKVIRERYVPKSITLVVTHGIFSKGLDVFDNIDYIYALYPFFENITDDIGTFEYVNKQKGRVK